jgi:hypothetical protein
MNSKEYTDKELSIAINVFLDIGDESIWSYFAKNIDNLNFTEEQMVKLCSKKMHVINRILLAKVKMSDQAAKKPSQDLYRMFLELLCYIIQV